MNRTATVTLGVAAALGLGLGLLPVVVLGGESHTPGATESASTSTTHQTPLRPGAAPPRERDRSASMPTNSGAVVAASGTDPIEAQQVMQAHQELGIFDPANTDSPQVGTLAPDFSLTPLQQYDFGIEMPSAGHTAPGELEPVTLSAFRNNLPVVLIFGSYT